MDPPSDPDQLTSVRSNGLPRGVPAEVADTGLGVAGCEFTVTAEPASASVARDRVSRWLRGAGWPPEPLEEVVYAVSEAVSNAIEHALPPGQRRHRRGHRMDADPGNRAASRAGPGP
jgi:hypothetical protein